MAMRLTRTRVHERLSAGGPTVADIALFARTHVAHAGGFELVRYPLDRPHARHQRNFSDRLT